MFSFACKSITGFKVYFKMDFDTYIDKEYMYGATKLMADNSEKNIFFGDIKTTFEIPYMEGYLYGVTGSLFNKYCQQTSFSPIAYGEDLWFANNIYNVTKGTGPRGKNNIHYMLSDKTKIRHKKMVDKGVYLNMGRLLPQSER
ncbi:hypothetical protein AYI68_g2851 [Smittium mucronatum]|uniref:Hexosyltransferase n=1 Tax=Smittium mucronatum TaxID=133383 RepID=A0A1R0H1K8_9FUNG|nr:hypothetical protein AYI68_g2851 [Smittium mucronatum]